MGQKAATAAAADAKSQAAIQGLSFDVQAKKISLEAAKETLALTPKDEKAKAAVIAAQAAVDIAELKLESAKSSGTGFLSSANASGTGAPPIAYMSQPGSVLYEVIQRPGSASLVPVNKQQFIKALAPKASAAAPAKLPKPSLRDSKPTPGKALELLIPNPESAPDDLSIAPPTAVTDDVKKMSFKLGDPQKGDGIYTIATDKVMPGGSTLPLGKYIQKTVVSGTIGGTLQSEHVELNFTVTEVK